MIDKKIVNFCLPVIPKNPTGGFKIIFEYANRLIQIGYEVNIYYMCCSSLKKYNLPENIRIFLCKLMANYYPRWFKLDRKIRTYAVNEIGDNVIHDGDYIFATAVWTAQGVYKLASSKGKKYYFIQDFENWGWSDQSVIDTYKYGMRNVVISRWLEDIVNKNTNKHCKYIRNAINVNKFKNLIPIDKRKKHTIAILYHEGAHKGFKYAFEVINILKTKYNDLVVNMFGVFEKPIKLPDWINYTKNATEGELVKIYNDSQVFLCASIDEGFGLTGLESMACGCVVVSTAYKGILEYGVNKKNCLLTEVRNVKELTENVIKVFENQDLMISLSKQATNTAKEYSWDNSFNQFVKLLENQEEL